jgi:hypothetical protein
MPFVHAGVAPGLVVALTWANTEPGAARPRARATSHAGQERNTAATRWTIRLVRQEGVKLDGRDTVTIGRAVYRTPTCGGPWRCAPRLSWLERPGGAP